MSRMLQASNRSSFLSVLLARSCCIALFCIASCGGDGGSDPGVTFGGAACESGVSFAQVSVKGYDELYNFENHLNQSVQVIFDTAKQDPVCADLVQPNEILPWVRIDLQDSQSSNGALDFQLVEVGGRNAPVLATYAIPDSSKESVHGTFAYRTSSYYMPEGLECDVTYQGSYCPTAADGQSNSKTTFAFSAAGTVDCTITPRRGGTPTTCHGVLTATNVTLEAGYYGE